MNDPNSLTSRNATWAFLTWDLYFGISNQYKVYKDLQRYRPDQTIIFVGGIGNGIRTYRTLSDTGHANGQGTSLCDERTCAGVAFEGGAGSERWELFDAETTKSLFTLSVVGHGGGVGGGGSVGSEEV